MQGKVAVEEHFAIPETRFVRYASDYWTETTRRLFDFHGERIARMDEAGIEIAVLSLNSSGIQAIADRASATEVARKANDVLAEAVARRPDRFAGLAALPMQDPEAAARELVRCVRELGFKGALANSFSQVGSEDTAVYYDPPQYLPFWAEVERLDVPFYLHPRDQLASRQQSYEGHPWLIASPWGFAEETALHTLRLLDSGLFDRYPKLQLVIGHLGERIPYDLWRLDHRLEKIPDRPARRTMTEYFRSNVHITTSGNFCTPSLLYCMAAVGVDRLLFAVDYPFEENMQGASWFDAAEISEADRQKIGRGNAVKLFGLSPRA
jgi:predicted TIM-barrel fold metal-dependent hydrolase